MADIDEEVLIKIAKDIESLELYVKKYIFGDSTSEDYCRKDFTMSDRHHLDTIVHNLSLDYCKMLKDALFQMTFTTHDLLEDLKLSNCDKNGK